MNGKIASLFFILGIGFLLVGIFGGPTLNRLKSALDSIEYADDTYDDSKDDDYHYPLEEVEEDYGADYDGDIPPPRKRAVPIEPETLPADIELRNSTGEKVYDFVEVAPEYPGGVSELRREVQRAYNIPRSYKNSGNRGGTIITRFTVTSAGTISDVQVLKGIRGCEECNEEAVRAIYSLQHRFEPGKQAGEPVNVRYTLPIVIRIR